MTSSILGGITQIKVHAVATPLDPNQKTAICELNILWQTCLIILMITLVELSF